MKKVLLVDDHQIVAEGLKFFVNNIDGYEVIGVAINCQNALAKTKEFKPDVILLDYQLPDGDGIALIPKLLQLNPSLKIIMLTSFADSNLIMDAVKAGAKGYLTKNIDEKELKHVLDGVFQVDRVWIDPSLTLQFVNAMSTDYAKVPNPLSEEERHLITLVAQGKTNREIAVLLFVTDQTVKNYLTKIYRKIGIRNRAEAASYAIKNDVMG